jgi:hypothetical protein
MGNMFMLYQGYLYSNNTLSSRKNIVNKRIVIRETIEADIPATIINQTEPEVAILIKKYEAKINELEKQIRWYQNIK